MTLTVSTIRPGFLISLKTSITGNVSYAKAVIDEGHTTEDGSAIAKWETERRIAIPDEHDKATKVRSAARNIIAGSCARSEFGLLCPEDKMNQLNQAVAASKQMIDAFNADAKVTKIALYVIAGRISQDDAEAVRAIKSEVKDLMDTMQRGLQNLDVKAVRDAANRAKSVGQMLSPAAQERVATAVEAARAAARQIVKAGEAGQVEIDQATMNAISISRTAFLDIDMQSVPTEITATAGDGRAVDFSPVSEVPTSPATSVQGRQIELAE